MEKKPNRMADAEKKEMFGAKMAWTVIAVVLLLVTVGAFGDNLWYGYYKETRAIMHLLGWMFFAGFLYGLWKFSQDAPTNMIARGLFIIGPIAFTFFATGFKVFS